ncbi:hypothetical protein Rcae01_05337 [Novipirellula caenicola]|uniref:Uncharacterized protein n=1 Tax=Novipirellula caenicola TaxID=1536901 RepID=A0ABP9VXH0_9BACT
MSFDFPAYASQTPREAGCAFSSSVSTDGKLGYGFAPICKQGAVSPLVITRTILPRRPSSPPWEKNVDLLKKFCGLLTPNTH